MHFFNSLNLQQGGNSLCFQNRLLGIDCAPWAFALLPSELSISALKKIARHRALLPHNMQSIAKASTICCTRWSLLQFSVRSLESKCCQSWIAKFTKNVLYCWMIGVYIVMYWLYCIVSIDLFKFNVRLILLYRSHAKWLRKNVKP